MFDYLYDWLKDLSYYLILVTAVTYALPSNSYRKYIRFFTGLVLLLMLLTPVLQLFGREAVDIEEVEWKRTIPEFANDIGIFSDGNSEIQNKEIQVEVEDIVIGP